MIAAISCGVQLASANRTDAALRNVTLDRLTREELPLVQSLIAYWDTLGWVHFNEGNYDKAEKYVAAAWGLGHHGEVGDHLGQIYEKRGEKDRALQTYALSMNGLRPAPETRGRLATLAGGEAKVDATVAHYKGLPLKQARIRVAREYTKSMWMRSQHDKAAKAQQATAANETVS